MNTARATRMPINILRVALISLAALVTASCSKQSNSDLKEATERVKPSQAEATSVEGEESKSQPSADDIVQDCYGFVWLTKATPVRKMSAECPQCTSTE